jgi:tetratricopeptide (TPR) repeat protein
VEELILRCLRKARAQRYGSMEEVAAALDECLKGEAPAALTWFASYVRGRVPDAPAAPPGPLDTSSDLEEALAAAREIASFDAHLYRVRVNLPRHFPALDQVIERLDRVLAAQPAAGWARFYRGLARFRRGDLEGAVEDMERAVDRVRDRPAAYFELGRLYLALYLAEHGAAQRHIVREGTEHHLETARSRLEQAGIAFAEARELPRGQAGYAEAVRRLAEQDFAGCVEICTRVLAEEPDLEEVWKLEGDALRLLGRDPLPAYARALEVRRSYYEVELARAEVHLARGEREQARDAARAALEIHPRLGAAHALLARALEDLGDGEGALAAAREARACEPGSYDAAVTLAELLLARGAEDEALAHLEAAQSLPGCQNRVMLLRARALYRRGTAGGPGGRADLEAALALCPRHDHGCDEPWQELRRACAAALDVDG